ncbi:hypothetical protein KIN20_017923 [Parelaphostrongylus tenuis]|uniref:Uncharacterized protein n=1 Tax=Parelaphostrongylus tenuis TaxID=148309 RepID=A0AAD5QU28_PARTN|nr:hypothetical protein KIN20_017923 [Parelaphostrongylus tenuis]
MNNHSTVFFPYGDSRLTESSLLTSPTESSLANEQNLQRTSTESQSVVDGDMPLNTNTSRESFFPFIWEEQLSSISPRQPNSDDLSEEACGDLSFCCSGEITRTPQASENVNESAESAASCDFNNLSETLHGRRFNCSRRDSMREKSTQRDPCENCNVSSVLHEVQESSRSCSLSVEEEKIPSRRTRIEMKNECMRLWSDKVQNLPKLLCFLQMCHRINGPLLINNCEKVLEDLINYDTKPNLCQRPNRMKVQPVDCILMSQFHLLPKGLTTEIYKIVLKTKRERNLEEVIAIMLPFSRKKDELSRRRDIIESILRVPDVMSIDGDYVKLRNDDEFFVVTGVINSNNSVAS